MRLVHWQHHFGRPAAPNVVQRLSRVCFANTFGAIAARTGYKSVLKQRGSNMYTKHTKFRASSAQRIWFCNCNTYTESRPKFVQCISRNYLNITLLKILLFYQIIYIFWPYTFLVLKIIIRAVTKAR